ncbi:hypothetical protein C8R43DRAFT_1130941 [Mycena crocata]|nr:hypothetical protein C8R43DRAFT_1130941 [Mycena crocata]
MTPQQMKAVLEGHGRHFLGSAELGRDYFPPQYSNWSMDAFVTEEGARTPEYMFKAIVFGQILSLPYVDWGSHVWMSIGPPDWSYMGWEAGTFDGIFEGQLKSLSQRNKDDTDRDLKTNTYPTEIRDWKGRSAEGKPTLILDVRDDTDYTVALEGGEYGDMQGPASTEGFPFDIGDTVVAEVIPCFAEADFSEADYRRNYTLCTNRMKFVKVKGAEKKDGKREREGEECEGSVTVDTE